MNKKLSRREAEPLAIFRPDSRNGSKDYYINAAVAKELFQAGVIYGDATNGGYMPSPNTPLDFKPLYFVKGID